MDHTIFTGQRIWCPRCKDHLPFLRIPNAARLIEVDRQTIYRHIEDGSVYVFRVGGTGTFRACSGCLVTQHASVDVVRSKNQSLKIKVQDEKTVT